MNQMSVGMEGSTAQRHSTPCDIGLIMTMIMTMAVPTQGYTTCVANDKGRRQACTAVVPAELWGECGEMGSRGCPLGDPVLVVAHCGGPELWQLLKFCQRVSIDCQRCYTHDHRMLPGA